jgi:hypothetical protein
MYVRKYVSSIPQSAMVETLFQDKKEIALDFQAGLFDLESRCSYFGFEHTLATHQLA